MRDVSENERDSSESSDSDSSESSDERDSSESSDSDSSESSDSDSSESSDSGSYSTGGRRREVVRRKVLQPSCFEFFRPCNAGINPSVICKQVNLAAKKKKKKMDVSRDSLASVAPRRLMPDFEAEARDASAAPRRLMPDFEAEARDASALNVRNDVRNNSINIRKNRMDSEDKHDGCRDPEICRRVKEKKRKESPEEIEKATKKAHEEMHRAEYYVGDMTRTIALTVPMQRTVWQSRLSLLFMACSALNLHPFQLLITSTNKEVKYVPPNELMMNDWQCPVAPQIAKSIKNMLREAHRLCIVHWNGNGFMGCTQRHHQLGMDVVALPHCPAFDVLLKIVNPGKNILWRL
jgi:hypothetical protein